MSRCGDDMGRASTPCLPTHHADLCLACQSQGSCHTMAATQRQCVLRSWQRRGSGGETCGAARPMSLDDCARPVSTCTRWRSAHARREKGFSPCLRSLGAGRCSRCASLSISRGGEARLLLRPGPALKRELTLAEGVGMRVCDQPPTADNLEGKATRSPKSSRPHSANAIGHVCARGGGWEERDLCGQPHLACPSA